MPNIDRKSSPKVAVFGAGAVGSYFGGMLARAGVSVTLIGRPQHVETINRQGLLIESLTFQESIPILASTDPSAARDADIVLLCVKTLDTETAATSLAPFLTDRSTLLSLQNGVDNAERIQAAIGIEAIPAVVYVAVEMVAPGHIKHTGRGDLIVGIPAGRGTSEEQLTRKLESVAALFTEADIPCSISNNIDAELWMKLTLNCAYNAVSALGVAQYGAIVQNPWTRRLLEACIAEVVEVATAAGIKFQESDMVAAGFRLGAAMKGATSSTAQDLTRGKKTEIDALNGYVVRCGAELGIATPVNQTLHALIKLLEERVSRCPTTDTPIH